MSAASGSGIARTRGVITIERTYRAPVEDLWALWATKAGFESWWAPDGCRVEVRTLEARAGGALEYDMIADAAEAVTSTTALGLPPSQSVRGWFGEFRPCERLTLVHAMDFVPGVQPYDHTIEVDFRRAGGSASMVVAVHPHFDAAWTQLALDAFKSQLSKLDQRFARAGAA